MLRVIKHTVSYNGNIFIFVMFILCYAFVTEQNILKMSSCVTQPSLESHMLCTGSGGDEFVTVGSLHFPSQSEQQIRTNYH